MKCYQNQKLFNLIEYLKMLREKVYLRLEPQVTSSGLSTLQTIEIVA